MAMVGQAKENAETLREKIGAAMLALLDEHDYKDIDIDMLAQKSGLKASLVKRLIPEPVLAADQALQTLDDAAMAQLAQDLESESESENDTPAETNAETNAPAESDTPASTYDKILEGLITRFETYTPHKTAIKTLNKAALRNPNLAAIMLKRLDNASRITLNIAGVNTQGLKGTAKIKALSAVAIACQNTWLNDETPDLAQTLRALDQRLTQAQNIAQTLNIIPSQ